MADFAARALILGLNTFLKANMPSLQATYDEWPNPNQKLKYPCLSTFSRAKTFVPMTPYVIAKGAEVTTGPDAGKYPVKTVMGMWDFQFQIDLWCDSKPTRALAGKELLAAFNKNRSTHGIDLQLADYHDLWVHYSLADMTYDDSEAGSQRSEWRIKIDVLVNTREVVETFEHLIEEIENNLETPNTIESPPDDSGGTSII